MTCLVALSHAGTLWMGGDRAVSFGDDGRMLQATPKVWRRTAPGGSPLLIGIAGSARGADAVEFGLEVPRPKRGVSAREYVSRQLVPALIRVVPEGCHIAAVVGWNGEVYEVDGKYGVTRPVNDLAVTGSGWLPAAGSLHTSGLLGMEPEARIRAALAAAAAFSPGVSAPFDIIRA